MWLCITFLTLSEISNKGIGEFFGEVMMCWAGDPDIVAHDHRELEELVMKMEAKSGVLLKANVDGWSSKYSVNGYPN